MSYSQAVKFQFYGIGLATGVLIACLIAGAMIAHASPLKCSGELSRWADGNLYCITNLGSVAEDDVNAN